jgi:hypothetical protein
LVTAQGIPAGFYQNHLPKKKLEFNLEDENGENHETMYLGDRNKGPGLSGGWNRFVAHHGIKVGDVVIFQLVDSRKFKASSFAFHSDRSFLRLFIFTQCPNSSVIEPVTQLLVFACFSI